MAKWGVSRLEDNPPRRVPYYPIDDSKEYITNFCQVANEQHAIGKTGRVYKVFKLEE
jgi:hypothetical protein